MICGGLIVILGVFLTATDQLPLAFAAAFDLLDAVFNVFNSARLIKVNVTHLGDKNEPACPLSPDSLMT